MKKKWIINSVLLFLVLAAAEIFVSGCGNANKEAGDESATVSTQQAATVGMDVCAQCHLSKVQVWLLSRHANTDPINGVPSGNPNSIGSPSYPPSSASCPNCHDSKGDSQHLVPGVTGNMPRNVIGCESCHGGGGQHFGTGPIALYGQISSTMGSAQFNTCTSCHMLLDSAGTTTNPSPQHSDDPDEVITDTHFDNPTTAALEGYNVSRFSDTACTNCHDPHTASIEANEQWRQSGHGDLTADPWSHYDWKAANRQSCQRCHTATGASNYLTSPTTYTAANNDFSHLTGSQLEVLYCNGCHLNASGGLRNPGAVVAPYTGATYTYPNAYKSNVCLACHTGRESGGTLLASTGTFANLTFINSHYLTAGGTVYTVTGYETWYTLVTPASTVTRTFTNPTLHHDDVGRSATPGIGDRQGPCVGCHMSTPEKHLFLPASKPSGTITTITSTVCIECHDSTTQPLRTPAGLEASRALMADALEALNQQLILRGYYFSNSYPYFFTAAYDAGYTETGSCTSNLPVKNWQTGGTSTFTWSGTSCTSAMGTAGTADTGKNNMGAAFNFNMLEHDPGAFVHNRRYAARLIYDAIDWLDDNTMNFSTGATLNALPGGTAYKSGAMNVILVNGTPTGDEVERP